MFSRKKRGGYNDLETMLESMKAVRLTPTRVRAHVTYTYTRRYAHGRDKPKWRGTSIYGKQW